ncbi:MAG: hypothetical protein J0I95_03625 [Microbacterium sp.]|uniref:hypothetical protein n=1 Tax=unclassified Microbacterium TaxID=2609290 RepID=UPI001AC30D2B|nr:MULTISPECIES: hypothetical protein [unclassified Microbacterium]MBN9210592.1 hypothetical protein [Microbacterium sp.]
MTFRADDRIYVDESKARGYFIVGTGVQTALVPACERAIRSLVKPGQRRIHFTNESDSRRRHLLACMARLDVRCAVWIAEGLPDKAARPLTLSALVESAVSARAARLIVERDASVEKADRRIITETLRRRSAIVPFVHAAPHEHPLLWVSDAVAWCYSRGGDWVRRVEPLVRHRTTRL